MYYSGVLQHGLHKTVINILDENSDQETGSSRFVLPSMQAWGGGERQQQLMYSSSASIRKARQPDTYRGVINIMLTCEYRLVFVFLEATLKMLSIATKLLVDRIHDVNGTVGLLY
jgi:hypothetical protein